MKNLFENTSSYWVRYSKYEYRTGADGLLYITPEANSQPILYDPLQNYTQLVLDALNLGMSAMKQKRKSELKAEVMEFVSKYGLLGFLTALPTTPSFMDYETVYLPKNHFIRKNPCRPRIIWQNSSPLISWMWSSVGLNLVGISPTVP